MKLGGKTILDEVKAGRIHIKPFNALMVGPNSVDLHLGGELIQVTNNAYFAGVHCIDPALSRKGVKHTIGNDGFMLMPGVLYLGHTVEEAGSDYYVPCIDGRSSIARDGLFVHISAGFGDVGFKAQWTLELFCVMPVMVYPGERIAQVYFEQVTDNSMRYDDGSHKYDKQVGPQLSKYLYKPSKL